TATTLPPSSVSTTQSVPQQTTTPIPTPPTTTDAQIITTTIPESDALSAVQLRVAKLEKDMSELKKIDLSVEALAALKTQVPSVVDKYLGSKVGDLPKKQIPTVDLEQGSKKSASEILKIKREQAEKQQTPKFTIKSTDKAALQEYDQKSALYQIMHANKSFNRNLANHRLYHALMEALIEDENAMDKGVANTVQDHKRKHDDDEDDDEDPPARPNQGKQTKRRRTNDSESSKNPSITKETPKGKAPSKGFKTGKSAPTKEPVKEPIVEVVMDDAGNDMVYNEDQPQDASEPKTTKTPNPDRFIQPPRPPTLALEWIKRQNNPEGDRYPFDLSKPLPLHGHPGHLTVGANYFFNNDLKYLKSSDSERTYTTSITKTKAARYEIEERQKIWHRSQLNKFSKHNVYSTKKIMVVKSVSVKKLHGYGYLEEIVVKRANCQLYKFKEGDFMDLHMNDIEDMLLLAVQHKLFHLTDSDIVKFIMALQIEFKEPYTPSHKPPGVIYEDLVQQKRLISDGTLKKVRDELHHRVLDFDLGYNKEMEMRKWTATDKKRFALMVELVDKQMRERRIIRNLERLVSARELEMDYKLMTHTT
ncbi:hypothetical protein Tco_1339872, partial [Tanacetum coccineum]